MSKREYTHVRLLYPEIKASINKSTHVGQPVFSVLFALLSLAGDSPPASKRTKIPRKSKAVRCEAVLPEQKCSQTRKRPQRILCVFSRALTQYEGISARQNRVCPCQSTQAMIEAGKTQREIAEYYGFKDKYVVVKGLLKRERRRNAEGIPKQRGRKPAKTLAEYKYENKRLKMENELLRDFLQSTGRK